MRGQINMLWAFVFVICCASFLCGMMVEASIKEDNHFNCEKKNKKLFTDLDSSNWEVFSCNYKLDNCKDYVDAVCNASDDLRQILCKGDE